MIDSELVRVSRPFRRAGINATVLELSSNPDPTRPLAALLPDGLELRIATKREYLWTAVDMGFFLLLLGGVFGAAVCNSKGKAVPALLPPLTIASASAGVLLGAIMLILWVAGLYRTDPMSSVMPFARQRLEAWLTAQNLPGKDVSDAAVKFTLSPEYDGAELGLFNRSNGDAFGKLVARDGGFTVTPASGSYNLVAIGEAFTVEHARSKVTKVSPAIALQPEAVQDDAEVVALLDERASLLYADILRLTAVLTSVQLSVENIHVAPRAAEDTQTALETYKQVAALGPVSEVARTALADTLSALRDELTAVVDAVQQDGTRELQSQAAYVRERGLTSGVRSSDRLTLHAAAAPTDSERCGCDNC